MENLVTRKEFETLADRVAALELSKLDVKDFEKEF